MTRDTGSDGSFCCGLPNPFKRKKEEQGPIGQARDAGHIEHLRQPVRIDDEGRPINSMDQPIQGSILHQRDDVGGDTPRIASLLATPADLYGQVIPLKDLTPRSAAGHSAAGHSAAGPSGGGPSAAGPSGGGPRAAAAATGGGPSSASEAVVVKGKDKGEAEENGGGNLATAINLI
ncbi:hypothetical protein NW768_002998 [Fusarium equiseti]|uniref:Uncharacterized protein n=1 Tax=Fusarium equiseti TaxID=61235 RepID=A0ABQ8RKX3_FUSEQ|nr:hypothetical protein NW768_002998 [Fusarium equiseti]